MTGRDTLRDVYWIGGGSGGGKSTVARRLAAAHGVPVYATDDVMADHARRSSAAEAPLLRRFAGMSMDERWLDRSPAAMLDTFHWFRGEGFGLIVADLQAREPATAVLAEGFRLLPHLVEPLLDDRTHAVWLLPTPAFREAAFAQRGSTWDIAGRTSDPERARRNLLQRDAMFTDRLAAETSRLGLPAVEVDVGTGEDELVARVTRLLGLQVVPPDTRIER